MLAAIFSHFANILTVEVTSLSVTRYKQLCNVSMVVPTTTTIASDPDRPDFVEEGHSTDGGRR